MVYNAKGMRNGNGNFTSDPKFVDQQYVFHDELGSGGFGKVKLATHLETGEKVAVKIIDKRAIGDDLPRVITELEALKQLSHQNICRMFQYIETEEKYYIVMELCNGGEMFDYIVRKERLPESEARHFFRQLVQAMAYIHSMGFAHRDLKPENLLLTQDLQLKVIDFGLCAKPLNGLNRPLETCCGSPAYAAPELIQNSAYYGNEADIWSMGVLLYALLCGTLPFEDENMAKLYKKITQGVYYEPTFLSPMSKELLRLMLRVNPKHRITVKQLLVHPWLNKNYEQSLKWNTIYNKAVIDEEVAGEMAHFYGIPLGEMITALKEWKFDYRTSTYLILLQKKERKQKFALPTCHRPSNEKQSTCSPTIHASLGNDLDFCGTDDEQMSDRSGSSGLSKDSPLEKSYAKAMALCSPSLFAHSPQQQQSPAFSSKRPAVVPPLRIHHHPDSPSNSSTRPPENKENNRPSVSLRARGTVVLPPFQQQQQRPEEATPRPKSIYTTPRRAPIQGVFTPQMYRRPNSVDRSARLSPPTPVSPLSPAKPSVAATERIARTETRSDAKTPRLRQRIYASLERKADKMITLLTPRKIKPDLPTKLKCIKTMVNVSITSSKEPKQVRDELWRVLRSQGMVPVQNGWKISGEKKSLAATEQTIVELEVVLIENLDYVGVKRKRIRGDAFTYKKICEEVLGLAGL